MIVFDDGEVLGHGSGGSPGHLTDRGSIVATRKFVHDFAD
jgi:hypothetical protein